MNENLENLKIDVKAFLTGYTKVKNSLKKIAAYENWQVYAKKEIERRKLFIVEKILGNFQIEALTVVASGDLDIAQLAEEVGKELDAKKRDKAKISENIEELKNDVKAFLTGYGKINRDALKQIATYENWQVDSNEEIICRTMFIVDKILVNFQIEALTAVASGDLDISQLAAEAGKELSAKKRAKAKLNRKNI